MELDQELDELLMESPFGENLRSLLFGGDVLYLRSVLHRDHPNFRTPRSGAGMKPAKVKIRGRYYYGFFTLTRTSEIEFLENTKGFRRLYSDLPMEYALYLLAKNHPSVYDKTDGALKAKKVKLKIQTPSGHVVLDFMYICPSVLPYRGNLSELSRLL